MRKFEVQSPQGKFIIDAECICIEANNMLTLYIKLKVVAIFRLWDHVLDISENGGLKE